MYVCKYVLNKHTGGAVDGHGVHTLHKIKYNQYGVFSRDIWLFITPVPKVYHIVFIIVGLTTLGTSIEF